MVRNSSIIAIALPLPLTYSTLSRLQDLVRLRVNHRE